MSATKVLGYMGIAGKMTDWHGKTIGTYKTVSTWKVPNGWISGKMHQLDVKIGGKIYSARSSGVHMAVTGKLKAK